MGSTITIASMPSSLMLGMGYDNAHKSNMTSAGSLSAAATPLAPPAVKHCTFALTPVIIPPPNNKISFLSKARTHANVSSNVTVAIPTATDITESTLVEEDYDEDDNVAVSTSNHNINARNTMEHRQSIQSQITTIDDLDTDVNGLFEETNNQEL